MPLERSVHTTSRAFDPQGTRKRRSPSPSRGLATLGLGLGLAVLLSACGTGSKDARQSGLTGTYLTKVGGGFFQVDENHSGSARRFEIAELFAARLVDVHTVVDDSVPAASRVATPTALFVDYAIDPGVASDGTNYRLETNPITQRQRLVILVELPTGFGDPTATLTVQEEAALDAFLALLEGLTDGLEAFEPKHDDGTSFPPFDPVPRNSAVVIRFNDIVDDSDPDSLYQTVRVYTGYPPIVPFDARIFFDENHGAPSSQVPSGFRYTRVIVDLTISDAEALASPLPLITNALGLPASRPSSSDPNVSIRIPTEKDVALGQQVLLMNASGRALSIHSNGPVDELKATRDIVRAARTENERNIGAGFMPDDVSPSLVGEWGFTIDDARINTQAEFALDLTFANTCRDTLFAGQVLQVGTKFLEVVVLAPGTEVAPDPMTGAATDVLVRSATPDTVMLGDLVGTGTFLPTYSLQTDPNLSDACWAKFQASPNAAFDDGLGIWTGVATTGVPVLRFTEPMTPDAVSALDSVLVVRGDDTIPPDTDTIVVGTLQSGSDSTVFRFQPSLPFAHVNLSSTTFYHVLLDVNRRPRDLAGNDVPYLPGPMIFRIDQNEATQDNGGIVLRLNSEDEVDPIGLPDLRGQLFYDFDRGTIYPRDALFASYPVDAATSNILGTTRWAPPTFGFPLAPGAGLTFDPVVGLKWTDHQLPLNPLGAKMQAVWRYSDLAWQAFDETKMNLDIVGMSWAPIGGIVSAEFYEQFEIALAHSSRLPDEGSVSVGMPAVALSFANSGIRGGPAAFADNVLSDPLSPMKVVHHRSQSYAINPADRFAAASGTVMMPFPDLNPSDRFLWRNTAAQGRAGDFSGGVPSAVEVEFGLEAQAGVETGVYGPPDNPLANDDNPGIPTFGLPLLMEFRCFPSQTALGLNNFAYLGNANALPHFRTWSAGGTNSQQKEVQRIPDLETSPSGGFNPVSVPTTGLATPHSSDEYTLLGQLDTVTRVSRAHSIWLDTSNANPAFRQSVVEPDPSTFPLGTQFILDYRGASSFAQGSGTTPFDSSELDFYGEVEDSPGMVMFTGTGASWKSSITDIDGSRYMQIRLTWINNVDANLSAEISALGFAFVNG